MKLSEAVAKRIEELKEAYNKNQYQLSNESTVPQTTLISIKRGRSKSVEVKTIYRICEGVGIELKDFFDSPLFASGNLELI